MVVDLPSAEDDLLSRATPVIAALAFGALLGAAVGWGGTVAAAALLALPLVLWGFAQLVADPRRGLVAVLVAGFVGAGLSRYVPGPTGLLVDFGLAASWLALLLRPRPLGSARRLRCGLFAAVSVWMLYNLFELFNPEARSLLAWFFAVRGVALYLFLSVSLGLLLFQRRDLELFLRLWLALSLCGLLWGLKQQHLGLDAWEQRWLSIPGNATTHLLFGRLRVFSFYSDSGQFGAAQGHAAVAALVLATGGRSVLRRALLALAGTALLWGLFISGTRGALAVPVVGGVVYLVLARNWKILSAGIALLCLSYGVLRYTHIGHGVYEIRRMRTAVVEGSENASLQVRLANQQRLATYLETKPFGGGVGSAGSWGQRFSPGTFLADLALDSWFVKIWAEQGPVGLALYLVLLAGLLAGALRRLLAVRDAALRRQLSALFSGLCGVLAASYGNQVLGQVPTGIVVAFSLVFLFLAPEMDHGPAEGEPAPGGTPRDVCPRCRPC